MSVPLPIDTLTVNPFKLSSMSKQQSMLIIGNCVDRQRLIKSLMDNGAIVDDYDLTIFVGIEGYSYFNEFNKKKNKNIRSGEGSFSQNFYNNCKGAMLKGFDKKILRELVDNQKYSNFQTHKTVIFNNCFTISNIFKNKELLEFFYNAKYYNISYILATSISLPIAPEIRCNFDMIFLLPDELDHNIKRLHRFYGGFFDDYDFFKKTFHRITKENNAMVIWNRGSKMEVVFYYSIDCPSLYGHYLIKNDALHKLNKIINIEKEEPCDYEPFSTIINIENIKIENLTITSDTIKSLLR